MSDSRREQIEELFEQTCSLSPKEREDFLDRQNLPADMRAEVERLLEFDQVQGGGLSGQVGEQFMPTRDAATAPFANDSSSSSSIDHGRFLPGTILANRYRIVGLLGEGGMGQVYRADDLELGQSVALKFVPEKLAKDSRALDRFRAEVRLSRQVSHPNVCRVYDIAQIDGQFFLSMEYVDGEDLRQLLTRIGHFNQERAIELARQLCMGLHAAHDKGVLHRDLKPANVMIDGRGKLLITDFGLAEFAEKIRPEDIRSGTPAYMSPEQLAGREVTQLSDIYSLGIILHELFTGKPAWEAESMAELMEKRSSDPRVSSRTEDLDPAIERIIERCLEPDPGKRPHSALNVMASLPGGDPLAAALGAGETPSPALVAAAGDSITFDSRMAVYGLVAVVIGLFLAMLLEDHTSPVAKSNLKYKPDALEDEIGEMLHEEFGYESYEVDTARGFRWFPGVSPDPIAFWYRHRVTEKNRQGFWIRSFWSSGWARYSWSRPDFFVPALEHTGETRVIMTGDKKLAFFCCVPGDSLYANRAKTKPKWSDWFQYSRTGYFLADESDEVPSDVSPQDVLKRTEDFEWTPPFGFDATAIWEGVKDESGEKFYVLAAAWKGRPCYYRVVAWNDVFDKDGKVKEIPTIYSSSRTREGRSSDYVVSLVIAAMIFGVFLAIRNFRAERVNRTGGRRLAYYVLAVNLVILFSFCRISLSLVDIYATIMCLGLAIVLFETARIWIWYMAIEPIVRRVWPQILITTSRLQEGRFFDPLVGRDILAGTVVCMFIVLAEKSNFAIHQWLGYTILPSALFTPVPVDGIREFVGTAASSHGRAFFYAVLIVIILLMARTIFRSERRSLIAATIFLSPMIVVVIGGEPTITVVVAIINSIAVLYLVVRFGVLALVSFYTCRSLIAVVPLTLDPDKWYFGGGLAAVGIVMAIALTGYAMATQKSPLLAQGR